ncbi:hypothetical protein K501DRAFT_336135 [Backusella circina FSU 941]|nr:hypothetical protein K501DRAFT_336135 [Backusella circina FSU 941]
MERASLFSLQSKSQGLNSLNLAVWDHSVLCTTCSRIRNIPNMYLVHMPSSLSSLTAHRFIYMRPMIGPLYQMVYTPYKRSHTYNYQIEFRAIDTTFDIRVHMYGTREVSVTSMVTYEMKS